METRVLIAVIVGIVAALVLALAGIWGAQQAAKLETQKYTTCVQAGGYWALHSTSRGSCVIP